MTKRELGKLKLPEDKRYFKLPDNKSIIALITHQSDSILETLLIVKSSRNYERIFLKDFKSINTVFIEGNYNNIRVVYANVELIIKEMFVDDFMKTLVEY